MVAVSENVDASAVSPPFATAEGCCVTTSCHYDNSSETGALNQVTTMTQCGEPLKAVPRTVQARLLAASLLAPRNFWPPCKQEERRGRLGGVSLGQSLFTTSPGFRALFVFLAREVCPIGGHPAAENKPDNHPHCQHTGDENDVGAGQLPLPDSRSSALASSFSKRSMSRLSRCWRIHMSAKNRIVNPQMTTYAATTCL